MNAQLTALVTVITGAVLRFAWVWVQAHITPEKLAHITDLARMAVRAAEQVGDDSQPVPLIRSDGVTVTPGTNATLDTVKGENVPLTGEDKYALASDALVAGARRLGIRLKADEVTSFIHAALKEMHDAETLAAQQ